MSVALGLFWVFAAPGLLIGHTKARFQETLCVSMYLTPIAGFLYAAFTQKRDEPLSKGNKLVVDLLILGWFLFSLYLVFAVEGSL